MMGTMQVQVPPGATRGTMIQATSPEGVVVQVACPGGVRPGSTFIVQYPISGLAGVEALVGKHKIPLLVVMGIMVLAFFFHGMTGPVVTIATFFDRVFHYIILLLAAAACIYYDWQTYGPTVAIQHGAISAAIAWILVVPLWPLIDFVVSPIFFLGFIVTGCAVAAVCAVSLGPAGCVAAVLVLALTFYLVIFAGAILKGTLGTTIVFLATYALVRCFIGMRAQDPADWPYVTKVENDSAEFTEQCDFLTASCVPWEHKYHFGLTVKNLYRIERPADVSPALSGSSDENKRRLFHGTPWDCAKGIIADGFRLPEHPGMFGKGVYFADCPLKSWRYCFANKQLSELVPRTTGRGGLILQCEVDLGTTREQKEAAPSLTGYNRQTWRAWFMRQRGAYDSVTGVTEEEGGALRVPEYVVYNPKQVRIAYLFEVMQNSRRG